MSNDDNLSHGITVSIGDSLFKKMQAHADAESVPLSEFAQQIWIDAMDNLPDRPDVKSKVFAKIRQVDGKVIKARPNNTYVSIYAGKKLAKYSNVAVAHDVDKGDNTIDVECVVFQDHPDFESLAAAAILNEARAWLNMTSVGEDVVEAFKNREAQLKSDNNSEE